MFRKSSVLAIFFVLIISAVEPAHAGCPNMLGQWDYRFDCVVYDPNNSPPDDYFYATSLQYTVDIKNQSPDACLFQGLIGWGNTPDQPLIGAISGSEVTISFLHATGRGTMKGNSWIFTYVSYQDPDMPNPGNQTLCTGKATKR